MKDGIYLRMSNSSTTQESVFIAYCALSGVSLLQWLSFIIYIVLYEIKKMNQDLTWSTVFTPLNLPLLVGGISLTGIYMTRALHALRALDIPWDWLFVLEEFFTANVEFSYIYYSWRRSGKLLRTKMSVKTYKTFYYFVCYSPILIFSPVMPSAWIASTSLWLTIMANVYQVTVLLAGITVCLLDATFTIAFLSALFATRLEEEEMSPELLTVAQYGITGCVLCFSCIGIYIANVAVPQPTKAYFELAAHATFDLTILTLFFMKVTLLRIKGQLDGSSVLDREKYLQTETSRLEARAHRASVQLDLQSSSFPRQRTTSLTKRDSAVRESVVKVKDSPEGSCSLHAAEEGVGGAGGGGRWSQRMSRKNSKSSSQRVKSVKSIHSVATQRDSFKKVNIGRDGDSIYAGLSAPRLPSMRSLAVSTMGRDSAGTKKSKVESVYSTQHSVNKKSAVTLKPEVDGEEQIPFTPLPIPFHQFRDSQEAGKNG